MQYQSMFLFPGVGSHYSGMGKTFYDHFRVVRSTFSEASDVLHCDMSKLCFSSEYSPALDRLENAQTALLCVSVALYRVLVEETGLEQAIYLGYSLGEYSALCCSGALDLKDALQLVRERGVIVTDVTTSMEGSMAWVVNLQAEQVEQICERLRQEEENIFVSAYDSPLKTSISGTHTALRKAGEKVVEAGGIPIPIKMSGPFHCPLMHAAADRFRSLLNICVYTMPKFPVISNFTAYAYETAEEIAENLTLQLVNPIRWKDSLEFAFDQGATTSVEIGPKDVLTYLLKENKRDICTYTTNTLQNLHIFKNDSVAIRNTYLKFASQCLSMITGTRNYNEDSQAYEEKVVPIFRKIQDIYEGIRTRKVVPDADLCQVVLKMLAEALHTKELPEREVTAHLEKLSSLLHQKSIGR